MIWPCLGNLVDLDTAYESMRAANIRPIITDIAKIDDAVGAYLNGKLVDHVERLH